MTGYTVHTGSTKKFAQGWDRIFRAGNAQGQKKTDKQRRTEKSRKKKK